MVKIDFNSFFDRAAVTSKVNKAARKVLSKAGAFVQRTAKNSIRSRKTISEPGQPPHSHTGKLKRLIFFGYDAPNESVVIGPLPFKAEDGGTTGASLLELGGRTRRRGRTVNVRQRAFMGPAMEKEAPNFPDLWKDSVE